MGKEKSSGARIQAEAGMHTSKLSCVYLRAVAGKPLQNYTSMAGKRKVHNFIRFSCGFPHTKPQANQYYGTGGDLETTIKPSTTPHPRQHQTTKTTAFGPLENDFQERYGPISRPDGNAHLQNKNQPYPTTIRG